MIKPIQSYRGETLRLLSTTLVCVSLLAAGSAAAQPVPLNDQCAGAEVIPATGPFPYQAPVVDIMNATTTGDPTPTCQSSVSRGIWYTFTPTVTANYSFGTCTTGGFGGTTVSDTVIGVYTSTGGCSGSLTALSSGGCDDDGCHAASAQSVTNSPLVAGTTYYVVVYKYSTTAPSASSSSIQLRVTQGAGTAGDVCSTAPSVPVNSIIGGLTGGMTNDYQVGPACYAGIGNTTSSTASGRDAVYAFTAPATGKYSVRVNRIDHDTPNPVLYVMSSCPTGGSPNSLTSGCFAANRSTTGNVSEEVSCVAMNQGDTFYAVVDENTSTTNGTPFLLEISSCVEETEPLNDLVATPNPFVCGVKGAITPAGDVDFYDLGTNTLNHRVFAVVDGVSANNTDFDLRVTDLTTTLEYDDADNDTGMGSNSPNIQGRALPAAPAFLRVSHFSTSTASDPYRLYAVVQPPAGRPETEPNNSLLTATSGATYFSGALSASSDLDFYAVNGNAGDVLIVGADGDPLRDGTAINVDLRLFDPMGSQLMVSADSVSTSTSTCSTGSGHTCNGPRSPGESLTYRLPVSGTYFVRVSGSSAGDYLLSTSLNCAPAVVITGLAPASGPTEGGTTVNIDGHNFQPGATVTIGGVPVTPSASSSTQITFVTPAGTGGAAQVVVTLADGRTTSFPFTYLAPPSISAIAPASGYAVGGTSVTISGANFRAGATVTFNGAPATGVTVTATSITATTPAGTPGPATVVVTNVDTGQTATTAFTYVAAPTVTSLSPTSGLTVGGTAVVITGTNFQSGATVTFDGLPAAVTFDSSTQLTVSTPGHAPAVVDVVVTNPDGQSATVTGGYEYVPLGDAPTIASITPASGTTAGGTTVVIAGADFYPGATVTFDGLAATSVTVDGPTQITAVTPAHAFGAVDVVVTNVDFQFGTLTGGFTYDHPAPTLTGISPAQGSTVGGTNVTLTGSNYLSGATVSIGGTPATNVVVVNATTITATTPAHAAGPADVVVTNADGKQVTLAQAFTFVPPPAPGAISPTSGTTLGGETFTITGADFVAGATVTFGGTAATNVTVVSASELTGTTPARAAGTVSVVVTNPDGQLGTLTGAFTFISPPTASSVSPTSGPEVGGTNVMITGSNFKSGATVTVGGVAATNVVVGNSTQIAATTPAGTGTQDVVVTNPDGQFSTIAAAFTYIPAPQVAAVSPTSGPTRGGTVVTVTGDKFTNGAVVVIGTKTVPATVVSATQLTFTTPTYAAGSVDVSVRNPDSQLATLTDAFTFEAPPAVTAITPSRGPAAGGSQVTLTGTAFLAGATVTFGGVPATDVMVADKETLTAVAPAHAPGFVDVVVTNPDGQSATLFQAFEYVAAPTLVSLAPTMGPGTGGTQVTLTGTGFASGTTVQFGEGLATSVVFQSPTTLVAVTPAHPAGLVDVKVTNPDGQSAQLDDAFTFEPVAPTLTLITPAQGPGDGNTPVLLAGSGFLPGATVTFDGVPATEVVVVNVNSITARTPPHAQGEVDVVVTNPDLTLATLVDGYRYTSDPTVEEPDAGQPTKPDAGVADAGTVDFNGGSTGCGCASTDVSSLMGFALVALGSLFSRRRSRKIAK